HGPLGKDGPLPEQPADKARLRPVPVVGEPGASDEVEDDVIVVSRIKGDLAAAARIGERPEDVQRLVSVEGSRLHRDDVLDVEKPAPKIVVERPPADRSLQVETEDRNLPGDALSMLDHRVVAGVPKCREAEEPCFIP